MPPKKLVTLILLRTAFDIDYRSGNKVGGSFKVSLWHTPKSA